MKESKKKAKKKAFEEPKLRMKIREFARYRRVSQKAIQKCIATGVIKKDSDGMIDVAVADKDLALNQDPSRTKYGQAAIVGLPPDPNLDKIEGSNFLDYRTQRERWAAETARMDFLRDSGSLVSIDEVTREAFKCGRVFRDAVLTLVERVASEIAAMQGKEDHEVHAYLSSEVEKMLNDVSNENKWGKNI